MAQWIELPKKPFYSQPDQVEFIAARRLRWCQHCQQKYTAIPPIVMACPTCSTTGTRIFDRLSIIAGRRFGKTKAGSLAGAEEAMFPNTIGWACAPTNQKLHRYVIPAFQELVPASFVRDWSTEYSDLWLRNGSLIHFQTLEDPDQGRGQGINWLWVDEISELTKMHWDVIRPSLAGDTVAFFTSSPRGFDWVSHDLCCNPIRDKVPGFWSCHPKTSDSANPDITAEFLARERRQMSDQMYRQEYEAEHVAFTGAVYGELIPRQILRTMDEIRKLLPEWPTIEPWRQVIIGIDTGADHPFGAVKMVSTEQGLVVVGDYLERDKTFAEHAGNLKRFGASNPVRWAANKNERQPMMELARHGISCLAAENDQMAGTERVKTWLHNRELWFVEPACHRTIQQMQSLRYAEPRKDGQNRDVTLVYKKNDELPDCIRYSVMTFPMLPKTAPKLEERDLSQMPADMRLTIERMRRVDAQYKDSPTIVDDFWM